jgi:hypothetical protein
MVLAVMVLAVMVLAVMVLAVMVLAVMVLAVMVLAVMVLGVMVLGVMTRSSVVGRAAVMAVVFVSRRVMPRVVTMMRPLRVPVSRWVMPRVMVIRVQPVVGVMTALGLVGMDAAVMETPGVPLAHAVPGRLRRLLGKTAAGTAAAAGARTAAPRMSRATLRRSRATMLARGDRDGGAGWGCGWLDDDGPADLWRRGRRCRYGSVLRGGRRRRGVHLDDRVDRPARERQHAATADRAQRDGSECAVAREHREAEDGRRPHAARPREHGRAFL